MLRGGPAEPKDQTFPKRGTAGGACWRLFSLLGASWLHLVGLAAFFVGLGRFLCVLPRTGPGFWRVSGGSGHGSPRPHFLRCFRDRELSMRLGS